MSALLAGALLSGGSALLQGIFGGVQAAKGNKGFNRAMANRPNFEIPSEYKDILAMYQQEQAKGLPNYLQMKADIAQVGARARGAAERGAISSASYGAQLAGLTQKEMDAIQGVNMAQADYKASFIDKKAGAMGALGQQQSAKNEWEKYIPNQTALNYYGEQKQAGIQNLFGALQGFTGNIADLAGTSYYKTALDKLQGVGSVTPKTEKITPNLTDFPNGFYG